MILLPALLLFSDLLRAVLAAESAPTYEHRDPLTGRTLVGDMCPPGTHMTAHCTASTPTRCAPCREDQYTEHWNYLSRCLYCNTYCTENQEVERECSRVNNRVCRCKEGFHGRDGFCSRHSECEPGHGVKTQGTPESDTVCERCPDGSFSNSSSALDRCVNHRECASGQIVLLPGSAEHDTVCDSCEDAGGEAIRTVISEFFSTHRIQMRKLRKFVTRLVPMSREDGCTSETLPRQRGPLLDLIRSWVAQAPLEQLKKLPQMLKATDLSSVEEKLQKRLLEIKQQTNCSITL